MRHASGGIPVLTGHTATGTEGRLRVKSVRVNPVRHAVRSARAAKIACDALLICGGWTPSLHLFSHTKGSLAWDADSRTFLPGHKTEACQIAGAGRGLWGYGPVHGGRGQGRHRRRPRPLAATPKGPMRGSRATAPAPARSQTELPTDRSPGKAKAFVDYQNDVTAKDIRLAVREGMRSIEHVKRYTTNGMATDQGKMSNINGLMIAADALGKKPPQVGLTTFRPPYTPTSFGAFAGYHKRGDVSRSRARRRSTPGPRRRARSSNRVASGAAPGISRKRAEDMHRRRGPRMCARPVASVGMFDASTLGKIEVVGPDAVEFMNRMYTNPWTKLAPGRCRYGLLLGEDGFIRDDGVIGRLAPDLFHVTTTTGGAARVMNMMEDYLQTEWPDLDVWLTSTTEQWATVALNGPNARKVLAPLVEGLDLSDASFPAHVVSRNAPWRACPRGCSGSASPANWASR